MREEKGKRERERELRITPVSKSSELLPTHSSPNKPTPACDIPNGFTTREDQIHKLMVAVSI